MNRARLMVCAILLIPFVVFSHDGKDLSDPPRLNALDVTFENAGDNLPLSDLLYPYAWEGLDADQKEIIGAYCLAGLITGNFPWWIRKDFEAWFELEERPKYPDLLYDEDFDDLLRHRDSWEKFLDYYVPIVIPLMEEHFEWAIVSNVGEGFQAILSEIDFEAWQ